MSKSSGLPPERPDLQLVKDSPPNGSSPSPSGSLSPKRSEAPKMSWDWPVPWESPLPPSESGSETPECSDESSKKPESSPPT